ncbi:ACRO protein, partial [Copsychus sechellarum]|nr:ACRO protein [Copsychus sechellarum]
WPGVISIQATLDNGTWHMCSGALIHPQWVLTVARCFIGAGDISRWEVVIGASDLSQPGPEAELRHIQTLVVHESYVSATAMNNIALLELERPVECSDYIQLGCVPDGSLAVPELKTCYMAGWRPAPASGQAATPHLCSLSRCPPVPKSHPVSPVPPRCGCDPAAAPDPSLPAQGDIGGPLVCKDNDGDYFWLVGLASWGRGCAGAKRPGVFTSTQHFHNWIQVQMGLVPSEA